ncbi:unnamed protein product [Allacma fusca]|uniref:Uncharacterized protein n=1 Tax=Allacma fusca TaxID=39272 RepID=A0A8J2J1G5_9HEXA|nr:unnamed protein product [Allacma fusca]
MNQNMPLLNIGSIILPVSVHNITEWIVFAHNHSISFHSRHTNSECGALLPYELSSDSCSDNLSRFLNGTQSCAAWFNCRRIGTQTYERIQAQHWGIVKLTVVSATAQ